MDGEFSGNRDKHGYGARGQGDRVGKNKERHGSLQCGLEADDFRIYDFDQARVESQRHDMEVGKKHLVEQPGHIADKSEPLAGQILDPSSRDEDRRGQPGHDGAGNHSQGEMKEVESPGENDPGGETDQKSEDERDDLFNAGGESRSLLILDRGNLIW